MMKNIIELEMAFERAWLEKEEKEWQKRINTIDFDAWEIDTPNLKIQKIIAEGAYGSVYLGIYHNKKVAVKVFHMAEETRRNKLESFASEVFVSKDLDHPNIIKFIGATKNMLEVNIKFKKRSQDFNKGQDFCLVTEFLCHGNLYDYLRKHQRLSISIVIQLALDIAKGLSYLHSKKIMHRDVKTKNMVLDKNGRVKIIDFGISGVEESIKATPFTGTIGYMAPEVFAGHAYNHKCDVYSFGICLWEIYCCTSPYNFKPIYDTIKDSPHLYKNLRPEIPSSCPRALADLMKKCWDSCPNKRPEMADVELMLREFEASRLSQKARGPSFLLCFSR